MNILAFDTATPVTSVAVGVAGALVAEISITGEKAQMERLMPMIDAALREAGAGIRDMDGIAVGIGPGLFTALRIGVTTANTLSQVMKVPLAGVSSLDVLAAGVVYRGGTIAAAIDARRGEVFASLYQAMDGRAVPVGAPRVLKPENLAAELSARDNGVTMVGDGFQAYYPVFKEALDDRITPAPPEFMYPRASSLLMLAGPLLEVEQPGVPGLVKPMYIRQPDADEHIKKMKK